MRKNFSDALSNEKNAPCSAPVLANATYTAGACYKQLEKEIEQQYPFLSKILLTDEQPLLQKIASLLYYLLAYRQPSKELTEDLHELTRSIDDILEKASISAKEAEKIKDIITTLHELLAYVERQPILAHMIFLRELDDTDNDDFESDIYTSEQPCFRYLKKFSALTLLDSHQYKTRLEECGSEYKKIRTSATRPDPKDVLFPILSRCEDSILAAIHTEIDNIELIQAKFKIEINELLMVAQTDVKGLGNLTDLLAFYQQRTQALTEKMKSYKETLLASKPHSALSDALESTVEVWLDRQEKITQSLLDITCQQQGIPLLTPSMRELSKKIKNWLDSCFYQGEFSIETYHSLCQDIEAQYQQIIIMSEIVNKKLDWNPNRLDNLKERWHRKNHVLPKKRAAINRVKLDELFRLWQFDRDFINDFITYLQRSLSELLADKPKEDDHGEITQAHIRQYYAALSEKLRSEAEEIAKNLLDGAQQKGIPPESRLLTSAKHLKKPPVSQILAIIITWGATQICQEKERNLQSLQQDKEPSSALTEAKHTSTEMFWKSPAPFEPGKYSKYPKGIALDRAEGKKDDLEFLKTNPHLIDLYWQWERNKLLCDCYYKIKDLLTQNPTIDTKKLQEELQSAFANRVNKLVAQYTPDRYRKEISLLDKSFEDKINLIIRKVRNFRRLFKETFFGQNASDEKVDDIEITDEETSNENPANTADNFSQTHGHRFFHCIINLPHSPEYAHDHAIFHEFTLFNIIKTVEQLRLQLLKNQMVTRLKEELLPETQKISSQQTKYDNCYNDVIKRLANLQKLAQDHQRQLQTFYRQLQSLKTRQHAEKSEITNMLDEKALSFITDIEGLQSYEQLVKAKLLDLRKLRFSITSYIFDINHCLNKFDAKSKLNSKKPPEPFWHEFSMFDSPAASPRQQPTHTLPTKPSL